MYNNFFIQFITWRLFTAQHVWLSINGPTQQTAPAPTGSVLRSATLPAIKMGTFKGDVETWSRFWEQFRSSLDEDTCLSTINKHVFLRGYLEGKHKMLVDGIAVTANAYEETKKILLSRYGDKPHYPGPLAFCR